MKIRMILIWIAASTLAFTAKAHAQAVGEHDAQKPAAGSAAAGADMTEAEVRKVDKESGKLTLKHAEIKSLDMPAMTMVFVVKDKSLLQRLKAGDKVRFRAVDVGGIYTITDLEAAQ
jgi:Cu/Ag efflux protein CusF